MKHRYLAAAASASVIAFTLLAAGIASAHGWGGAFDPQESADRHAAMFEEQATLLGVSADVVKDAWSQGKSLQDLATEKGVSQEELRSRRDARRRERMKAELQALVDKGVVTQAQADARLETMSKLPALGKSRRGGMMPHGGMGFGR